MDALNLGTLLTLCGVTLLFLSVPPYFKKRKVEDLATSKIGSAPAGLVQFQAYAWPMGHPVLSLQGHYCVYHRITVEEDKGNRKSENWREVATYSSGGNFILSDGSGSCIVMADSQHFRLADDVRTWHGLSPEEREEVCKLTGFKPPVRGLLRGLFANPIRIREEEILLGAPVLGLGAFEPMSPPREVRVPHGLSDYIRLAVLCPGGSQRFPKPIHQNPSIAARIIETGHESVARDFYTQQESANEICQANGYLKESKTHKLFITDSHQELFLSGLGASATRGIPLGAITLAAGIALLFYHFGI